MARGKEECKNMLYAIRKLNSKLFKGKDKKSVFDKRYTTNWSTVKKYNEDNCHCPYCAEYKYLADKYGCSAESAK